MHFEDKGAFTGEISAPMIKIWWQNMYNRSFRRRKYFGETDEAVNKKIKKALEVGLKVIFLHWRNCGGTRCRKKNRSSAKTNKKGTDWNCVFRKF